MQDLNFLEWRCWDSSLLGCYIVLTVNSYQRFEESVSTTILRNINISLPIKTDDLNLLRYTVPTYTDRKLITRPKMWQGFNYCFQTRNNFWNHYLAKRMPNFLHYTSCQGPYHAIVQNKWMYFFPTYWTLWITRYVKELRRRSEGGFECRYIPTHEI
jgi:hypothetical protein